MTNYSTSILSLLEIKLFIERRWLGATVREKRFLDTDPNVALNVVQMAHVWSTHELPKEYSDLGEVSALTFQQRSYSVTCTCLQPLRDSPEVMTNNCASIENAQFLDVCFTMRIEPAKFTEIFRRVCITHQENETPIRYDIEYFSIIEYRSIDINNNISYYTQAVTYYSHLLGARITARFQASSFA